MKIDNLRVYGLNESIVASGLPKRIKHDGDVFADEVLAYDLAEVDENFSRDKHYSRAIKLAHYPTGSGHCNFLSGIVVQMNITATVKWWEQWQRYHFQQIVSSMSSMHCLRDMMEEGTIQFNENTDQTVIDAFMSMLHDETVTDAQLAYSCPMGLELTAMVSTNYLQLRTMYQQRKHHKLDEWKVDFMKHITGLPYAKEFITGE